MGQHPMETHDLRLAQKLLRPGQTWRAWRLKSVQKTARTKFAEASGLVFRLKCICSSLLGEPYFHQTALLGMRACQFHTRNCQSLSSLKAGISTSDRWHFPLSVVLWRPTETRDEVGQDDGVLFLQGCKLEGGNSAMLDISFSKVCMVTRMYTQVCSIEFFPVQFNGRVFQRWAGRKAGREETKLRE